MADTRRQLGAVGETIAADYLTTLGWRVCARNWRNRYGELDIVAREPNPSGVADTLVIVEVKTRLNGAVYDDPVAAVTDAKLARMVRLAWMWIDERREAGDLPYFEALRFDAISVRMDGESGAPTLRHHRGLVD
ncbi:YraN family protein [Gordonia sp. X0973]|uniref:YraN family protein n=1 Tax=Gordonia sp. X0973 TaxID=2742602 RepID=UPI000F543344|nr:YraN family protein [Gordonia sp. X0973]QKT07039.1 YraN family protein [Gordonia sp. X0973]